MTVRVSLLSYLQKNNNTGIDQRISGFRPYLVRNHPESDLLALAALSLMVLPSSVRARRYRYLLCCYRMPRLPSLSTVLGLARLSGAHILLQTGVFIGKPHTIYIYHQIHDQ